MKMAFVVVSYKNPEQTEKCINLLKGVEGYHHDNSKKNLGFTKAYNKGIQYLMFEQDYEYVLVINSDCYVHDGFVRNLQIFMDTHPRCGIAGVKQIASDGDTIVHAGCSQAYPYGVHISGKVSLGMHNESNMVPWINGACFVVRREMVKEIGLMDENLFLIGSDSDWCFTARARGWEVWYCAEASCTHDGGVSKKPHNEEFEDIMFLDMKYWESKWVTGDLYKRLCAS